MEYTKEIKADGEWRTYADTNAKGESLIVNIKKIECNLKDKRSLMNIWKKAGYISEVLPTYWSIDTYINDTNGNCRRAYDPTIIDYKQFDSKGNVVQSRHIINFEWLLEATEENYEKLMAEVERRFMEMIPTEKKREVA